MDVAGVVVFEKTWAWLSLGVEITCSYCCRSEQKTPLLKLAAAFTSSGAGDRRSIFCFDNLRPKGCTGYAGPKELGSILLHELTHNMAGTLDFDLYYRAGVLKKV